MNERLYAPYCKGMLISNIAKNYKLDMFLDSEGFSLVSNAESLVGKVAAVKVKYGPGLIVYPVDKIVRASNGNYVVPQDEKVVFIKRNGQDTLFAKRKGFDLFIPDYAVNLYMVFAGDKIPEGTEIQSERFGLNFPSKRYISEEELKLQSPDYYGAIVERIASAETELNRGLGMNLEGVADTLAKIAKMKGLSVETELRQKTPVGIYSNLERKIKDRNLGNIWDINGVRIIAENSNDCYTMLSAIDEEFLQINKVLDFIAVPKSNGYQCIILRPKKENLSLEIQIQTRRMKEIAEFGSASNYRINYNDAAD